MVVCKFGGSSVADAARIRKVKAIVDADSERQIVVVSAPGRRFKDDPKVTDLLYACNDEARKTGSCRGIFSQVGDRYLSIMKEFKADDTQMRAILEDIRQKIDAGMGADYAASRGEYLSARMIAQIFGWTFLDAEQVVAIAPDGTVDPSSYAKIAKAVAPGKRYIVPGFYGTGAEGRIQTFARGGSDITGSVFARALKAEKYENWTDVSGVYGANPLVVPGAKPVAEMTYTEMRELSGVGAGVFQEDAIAPVFGTGIPINVKNTGSPDDPGTMIVPSRKGDDLVGLSVRSGFDSITVRKLMLFRPRGIRHALLTMMQVFGVRPTFSMYGIDSIVWYFDKKLASPSVESMMAARLKTEFKLDDVAVKHDISVLGIVGQGLASHPETVTAAMEALKKAGVPPVFVNYGSSDCSMLIGLPGGTEEKAQKALYKALF